MITAAEALKIFQDSGADVVEFISKNIDPKIRLAALVGDRECFVASSSDPVPAWCSAVYPDERDQLIIQKLRGLGFHVSFGLDLAHKFVPAALANDDGDGEAHCKRGFFIRW